MKKVLQHPARLIALLLVSGTIGLLLLVHVTSARKTCCERETTGVGIIKLI